MVFALLATGGAPAGLFDRGPYSSDFLDAQAEALVDGRLDVDPAVAGIEGFRRDGRTHLYFGLFPALLRLPVVAVWDGADGRLTIASMLVALAVASWAAARLVWRARRWMRDDGPPTRGESWILGAFVATVGIASPLLFLAARPVVYHEVELWGTAMALVSADAVLHWWARPAGRRLAIASLATAAAFSTRASVGGGAVAAFGLVAVLAFVRGAVSWRRLPALGLALLLPLVPYGAVNTARFGSSFVIPFHDQVWSGIDADRQATLEATDGTLFGPEFAPTALLTYLRPDGIRAQTLFPWVTFPDEPTVVGNPVFDTLDLTASLPVVAPVLLVAAAVGLLASLRRFRNEPWTAVHVGFGIGLGSTVTIAFVANRYLADFTPLLVTAAAPGIWCVAGVLARWRPRPRRATVGAAAAATVAATAVSVALAVQSQRLYIVPEENERRDFVAFQYDLDDRRRDGAPPAVEATSALGAPRRGAVRIVDRCAGLYWSDGRRWFPLELGRDRGIVLEGPLPDGSRPVLVAAGWSLEVESDGTTARLRYVGTSLGEPATRMGATFGVAPGDRVRIVVGRDPATSQLTADVRGRRVLWEWLVDVGGVPEPGAGWTSAPAATPLCDRLATRLAGDADGQRRPRAGSSS